MYSYLTFWVGKLSVCQINSITDLLSVLPISTSEHATGKKESSRIMFLKV
jgi:hypothetical protein